MTSECAGRPLRRLAFLPAGLLPFVFGSCYTFHPDTWQGTGFLLGLLALALVLAGGLLADAGAAARIAGRRARSGYSYYGAASAPGGEGGGLLAAGVACWLAAGLTAAALADWGDDRRVWIGLAASLVPAVLYAGLAGSPARQPWGAVCVLAACGPVPLLAGRALQGGAVFDARLVGVSLAFGFLAAAVALADDTLRERRSGPGRAAGYLVLTGLAFLCVVVGVGSHALDLWSLWCALILLPALHAAAILKGGDPARTAPGTARLLALAIHLMASLILLADVVL